MAIVCSFHHLSSGLTENAFEVAILVQTRARYAGKLEGRTRERKKAIGWSSKTFGLHGNTASHYYGMPSIALSYSRWRGMACKDNHKAYRIVRQYLDAVGSVSGLFPSFNMSRHA